MTAASSLRITGGRGWTAAPATQYLSATAAQNNKKRCGPRRGVSIQVAILKVLASHGNGRATLASLKRDIVILTASGGDWSARLRRLSARVPAIDIFGNGHVMRDDEGWQITTDGRDFLRALEAVTQDNRPAEIELPVLDSSAAAGGPPGELIVVGHRFKSRLPRRNGADRGGVS
jgi:hypothetical protein